VNRNGGTGTWDIVLWSTNREGTTGFLNTINVPTSPSSGVLHLDGGSVSVFENAGLMYVRTIVPDGARIHRYEISEST